MLGWLARFFQLWAILCHTSSFAEGLQFDYRQLSLSFKIPIEKIEVTEQVLTFATTNAFIQITKQPYSGKLIDGTKLRAIASKMIADSKTLLQLKVVKERVFDVQLNESMGVCAELETRNGKDQVERTSLCFFKRSEDVYLVKIMGNESHSVSSVLSRFDIRDSK